MHEFIELIAKYRRRINIRLSFKALVGSIVLFLAGFQLYLIAYKTIGAYSPALVYANIAIRIGMVLSIIYVLWQAYLDLWDNTLTSRYLDLIDGTKDDLYQNTWELYQKDGSNPITEALAAQALSRIKGKQYPLPKVFSPTVSFAIVIFTLFLSLLWYVQSAELVPAFKQFYTNKAPEIFYKEYLELSPGNITIGKNQQLQIRLIEPDKRLKHRLFYRVDKNWRELALSDDQYLFQKLEQDIEYYASNEVAQSPVYRVTVLDMPLVKRWVLDYHFPAYTGIPSFSDSLSYGNIEAYKGSKVQLKIHSNIPLKKAEIVFSNASRKALTPSSDTDFTTLLTIDKDEHWHIELEDHLGRKSPPEEKQTRLLADLPPEVRIVFPGEDVNLNQNLLFPLIISADDDFGLANLSLYYQLNNQPVSQRIIQSVITGKLFNTDYLWDLNFLQLFPGDIVSYWAEVYDNSPTPQKGKSAVYKARFPSIEEIYREIELKEKLRQDELSQSLEESNKLQEKFEQKRRELLKNPELAWEDKQELANIIDQQRELLQNVEQAAEEYQQLIDKLKQNSALSMDTLEKMMRIQELMEEIATPELFEALSRLESAMEQLSPDALRIAMEDFKFSMEDFATSIEQTLALLESIKNEQAVEKALQIAQEMEKLQQALNQKTMDSSMDKDKLAGEQAGIKEKLDNLKKELNDLREMLAGDLHAKRQLDEILAEIEDSQINKDLMKSQNALSQNQRQEAGKAQESALEKMRKFTLMLSKLKDSMSSGSQAEMKDALELAIRQLLILSKNHELSKAKYDSNPFVIVPDLIAGYESMQVSLNTLFSKPQVTMVIPPKFYFDVSETNKAYRSIFSSLGQANIPNILSPLSEIQKGLNLMIHDLILGLQNSSGGGGGGGGMQSLMETLQQMGEEQMMMNMLTQQLMMQMQADGGQADGQVREQMERLAEQEERLAENLKRTLEEIPDAKKQSESLKRIIEDVQSVSKQLRSNRLDRDLLKQQENILSKLLDASRSITKREHSEKREAHKSSGLPSGFQKAPVDYEKLRRTMLFDDSFKSYPREYQELIMEYLKLLQEAAK